MSQIRWSDDDLVTGEAVALDLPAATVGLRLVSGVLDLLSEGLLMLGLLALGYVATSRADDALRAVTFIVALVLALVVFPATTETLTRGRTLGKLACGLRTVRDDAGPISFRHAFLRALVGVVEVWALSGVPALLCALVNNRGKRLGDVVAGTYVVRHRFAMPLVRPVAMPRELARWAGSADVAPLPDGFALATRQFLDRAPMLNPASRQVLAEELLAQALTHVAPPPPSGHHPEALLAAVLAERRRRDETRLAREQALLDRLAKRTTGGTSGR